MVNNAGINKPKPIYEFNDENFDYLINLDFRSYIMMMCHALAYMIAQKARGCIINITSSRGEWVYPNCGLYCGMKAGPNHAIEAFALDMAPYGIRINNVAPGAVRIRTKGELADMTFGADTCMAPEDKVTGQSVMTMTESLASVLASLTGGLVLGSRTTTVLLWCATGAAIVGTLITGLSHCAKNSKI